MNRGAILGIILIALTLFVGGISFQAAQFFAGLPTPAPTAISAPRTPVVIRAATPVPLSQAVTSTDQEIPLIRVIAAIAAFIGGGIFIVCGAYMIMNTTMKPFGALTIIVGCIALYVSWAAYRGGP